MSVRDTILKKSYELFYQQGFHESGVELLAKQAGTTKRTLYAHFGNKEGLIEAVLGYRHQMFMSQLADHFNQCQISTSAEVMQCYLSFLRQWTASADFYGCMFINACAEYSSADSVPHQIANQHKGEVRQWLLQHFEQVGESQAQKKADMLFVWGEGLIVTAQTDQQPLMPDDAFLQAFD